MAKKKSVHKNKSNVFRIFLLLVVFLLLSLIIPAIGIGASSPMWWINIVTFFESVKVHFGQYWMFYSFAAVVILAYFGNKK